MAIMGGTLHLPKPTRPDRQRAPSAWARWAEDVAAGNHRRAAKVIALGRSAGTAESIAIREVRADDVSSKVTAVLSD
jgi:hypothetical protein